MATLYPVVSGGVLGDIFVVIVICLARACGGGVMVLMLFASGSTAVDLSRRQRGGFAGLTHGRQHKEP